MRTGVLPLAVLALAVSCSGGGPRDAAALQARLQECASAGTVMYGHQDDLVYGHSWCVTDIENDPIERSDVKAVCGSYPAVVGFDLGGIETGDDCNLDGVPFALMRKAALTHIGRGGVVTFSWHPRNPLTGGDAWDISSGKVVESVLPGGSREAEFALWLDRAADFLSGLGGEAVIFRPWHENIGSWFWWGGSLCTPDQYKALYRLTREHFASRGLDNILWCYSPNGPVPAEDYMSRYPGDDCVDILGTDIYEYPAGGDLPAAAEAYRQQTGAMLSTLRTLGEEHGKLICLSETGLEGLPDPHWWTGVLLPAIKDYPVSYVLTWRNAHDKPGHFYAPWEGFEGASDFKAFCDSPNILMLDKR